MQSRTIPEINPYIESLITCSVMTDEINETMSHTMDDYANTDMESLDFWIYILMSSTNVADTSHLQDVCTGGEDIARHLPMMANQMILED